MLIKSSLFSKDSQLAAEVYDLLLSQHLRCVFAHLIADVLVSLPLEMCLLLQKLIHLQEGLGSILLPYLNHFPSRLLAHLLQLVVQVKGSPSSCWHFFSCL